ncbi:Ankyrin repeat [Sesbania bispinosa]|nr:Ankyrin repeat [Sesbania bispinosa]
MEKYLRQGLGGVVSEVEIRKMTKNAKALHIIQLSCEGEILDEISHFETAKDVWYHLSRQYEVKSKVKANTDITIASVDDSYGENIKLFKEVERGYYSGNIGERIYSKSASGRTLLHVAAIAGHVNVVEKLVKEGEDKLVNMKDERGYTALALVSHYTGNTEIAKCMVENELGEKLLSMQNSDGEIPVLLAAANGRKKMTTYLYSRTPQEVLKRDFRDRVLLLERCITARIFDI